MFIGRTVGPNTVQITGIVAGSGSAARIMAEAEAEAEA
jgi:hypothetical protein